MISVFTARGLNESKKGGGGRKPPSGSGCLASIATALAFAAIVVVLLI